MLESNTGAYLNWLVNELNLDCENMKHNDALFVTFFTRTTKQLERKSLHIIESREVTPTLSGKSC